MIARLKRGWQQLKNAAPGHRFQERAERNRRKRPGRPTLARLLTLLIGILLVGVGVVFCLIPGPGLALIFLGLALFSERSPKVARCLDSTELNVRKVSAWGKGWWRHATNAAKFAALLAGMMVAAGAVYVAYSIMVALR